MKMGKLYLYYKNHHDSEFGDILKVKINEEMTTEVLKNEIYEQELNDGTHNIKMYFEGWTKDQLVGYLDQDIEINGNTYYIYDAPATLLGKGKLVKLDYNSPEEFKEYVNGTNKRHNILSTIFFVIALIIIILYIIL